MAVSSTLLKSDYRIDTYSTDSSQQAESTKQNNLEQTASADTGIPKVQSQQAPVFSEKVMKEAAKKVNAALIGSNTRVEFSVFKPTHEIMVKIKDNETGKVIREIPSKKDLEMAAYMKKLSGIMVDEQV